MASSTSETSQNKRSASAWISPDDAADCSSPGTTENAAKIRFRVDPAHSPSANPHTAVDRPTRPPRSPLSSPAPKPRPTTASENLSSDSGSIVDQPASTLTPASCYAKQHLSHHNLGSAKPEAPLPPGVEESISVDLPWHALHAENIAEVLEKRLYEVERREHLLNRRAALLAMEERKFRLWAHEEKMLLRQQQREHAVRQEELNRRSADLRWLLLMEDTIQTENERDFVSQHNSQTNTNESTNSLKLDASSEFFENFCERFEELFQEDSQGIRRLKNS